MRDGAVGQHALDVGLGDGDEVAYGHRQRRQDREYRAPLDGERLQREGHVEDPEDHRESGSLARHRQEGGDRRWGALVHVRGPHLEGEGSDLEPEPGDYQHRAEQEGIAAERQVHVEPYLGDPGRDVGQHRAAGEPVDEDHPIEQQG